MSNTPQRDTALAWIAANEARLSAFNARIWAHAEPAWREYRSARDYVELLRAEGFTVEEGSGGMPTAFVAEWSNGAGPTLASFAEYDAVPGNSQQVVPREAPREGLHPYTAGHTDPHSVLGTAALAGVLGARAAMQAHGVPGTLKLFGEPAEKVCGSKPIHAAKGYYDGLDAAVVWHPWPSNTVTSDTHFGAYWSAVISFEATSPETWIDPTLVPIEGAHAAARCPGALDALCLMYTTTKYTKEAMFPHAGSWTLNEFVLGDGGATSDNLAPRFSQIQYSWRSSSLGIQEQIWRVLANNARHVAAMTGCRAFVRWVTKTRVGVPNQAMTDLTWKNLQAVGAPVFPEEALEFGRAMQRELGLEPMPDPFIASVSELTPPEAFEAEAAVRPAVLAEASQRRRLCGVLLACADGAAAGRAAAAAPADAGLRLSELDLQRPRRAAGGDGPRDVRRGQDHGADAGGSGDPAGDAGGGAGGVPRPHRRHRRAGLGRAAAAGGFRPAGRPALAGIRQHPARRGMVHPDAAPRDGGRGSAVGGRENMSPRF